MAKKHVKEKDDDEKKEINVFESNLVPKHDLLSEEEKNQLLQKLNISLRQLPRIKSNDAVVKSIGGKRGDVIKITRKSPVAGEYYYYRVVV
jgi:DNA-directed RNA polymerase subunit H (RpoH/RPB5)